MVVLGRGVVVRRLVGYSTILMKEYDRTGEATYRFIQRRQPHEQKIPISSAPHCLQRLELGSYDRVVELGVAVYGHIACAGGKGAWVCVFC